MANKLLYTVLYISGEKVKVRFDDGIERLLSPASVKPENWNVSSDETGLYSIMFLVDTFVLFICTFTITRRVQTLL